MPRSVASPDRGILDPQRMPSFCFVDEGGNGGPAPTVGPAAEADVADGVGGRALKRTRTRRGNLKGGSEGDPRLP